MRAPALLVAAAAPTACGPTIESVDLARNDAQAFSTRADAAPVRAACPPGTQTLFADEDYDTLEDGRTSAPLLARFRDPSGLRRAAIVIPAAYGRPLGRPDLVPVRVRLEAEGREALACLIEYRGEADGYPAAADLALVFAPGLTSGDGFCVEPRDDGAPVRWSTRAFASVRTFGSVCQRRAG